MRSIAVLVILSLLAIANCDVDIDISSSSGVFSYKFSTMGTVANPTLTLEAGQVYYFTLFGNDASHPIIFVTDVASPTTSLVSYASPNPASGSTSGVVVLTIPYNIGTTTIYYYCVAHGAGGMKGTINISQPTIHATLTVTAGRDLNVNSTPIAYWYKFSSSDNNLISVNSSEKNPSIWAWAGKNYLLDLTSITAFHPMNILDERPGGIAYQHVKFATPNGVNGTYGAAGSIVLRIPTTYVSNLNSSTFIYFCYVHGFTFNMRGNITVLFPSSSSSISSTSDSSSSTGTTSNTTTGSSGAMSMVPSIGVFFASMLLVLAFFF